MAKSVSPACRTEEDGACGAVPVLLGPALEPADDGASAVLDGLGADDDSDPPEQATSVAADRARVSAAMGRATRRGKGRAADTGTPRG